MAENTEDDATTLYLKRVFTSGYMLGRKHGYATAVEESYPELRGGEPELSQDGDPFDNYLYPLQLPQDPNKDFK
jgi:hypothetical protein